MLNLDPGCGLSIAVDLPKPGLPSPSETTAELSATDGHMLLLEYLEERPPLLGHPGMGAKLTTFYMKVGGGPRNTNYLNTYPHLCTPLTPPTM